MKKYLKVAFVMSMILLCVIFPNTNVEAAEVPITAEYFPEEWMREVLLTSEYDLNSDGILSEEENKQIEELKYDASSGKAVTGMEGMEHLLNADKVSLYNITEDEVFIDTGNLKSLFLYSPQIETMKISSDKLDAFAAYDGGSIASLKIEKCKQLRYVGCNRGRGDGDPLTMISRLQISNCPKLDDIECINSDLKKIKVVNCPNITRVDVSYNSLSTLKIKSKKMEWLHCSNNLLTKLDIANYKSLRDLNCNDNKIEKLDFRNCKKLVIIRCKNNRLKKVELPYLKKYWNMTSSGFTFTGNQIKYVKLSDINVLGTFLEEDITTYLNEETVDSSFARNKIKTVDISSAKKIKEKTRIYVKRFFTGDYVKRWYDRDRYINGDDENLKNRPIKKIIISKNLRQKDKKWIEKLGKEYKVKVVVR